MRCAWAVVAGAGALLLGLGTAVAADAPPAPGAAGAATRLPVGDPFVPALEDPWEGFLATSAKKRLLAERQAVAKEFQESLQFDPEKVKAALLGLDAGAADTPQDNIDRTAAVLAAVDADFAKAYALYAAEKWADAGAALAAGLADEKPSYQAALKRLLHGECLARAGRTQQAADAWQVLVKRMPERLSFASTACLRLAEAYEKLDRQFYALAVYKWWVRNYSFLDLEAAQPITEKITRLEADYKDPLNTVSEKMYDVGRRLKAVDSGDETQTVERRVLAMLNDLIQAAEDQEQQQSRGRGRGQGRGQGMAGSGAPQGIGQPSSPATTSALVGGDTVRPDTPLSEQRPTTGSDDWGKLKPRERQDLIEAFKEMYPERYREMLEAYYKTLAGSENP